MVISVHQLDVSMITKYFANVKVVMPTTGKAAKACRVFLSNLPPSSRQSLKLECKVQETAPAISVKYKDGTTIDCEPGKMATIEMFELFDRQSRKLQVNDSLRE